MKMLEVKNLEVNYGAIKAVQGIDFYINEGEIVTLIGANGAGKTTTMNTIIGIIKAAAGEIIFNDTDISKLSSSAIVKSGIALSPEGRQIFPRMTVLENLEMGAYSIDKKYVKEGIEQAYELFPRLQEREKQVAGTLSGGEQQMLAVARALMSKPKLLMLDEPSLGLAPIVVEDIFRLILRIRKMGTTILLVEQNARMALSISDRGYVLETGKIVLTDDAKKLLSDPKVIDAYFGGLE
ncbi:high-affinity branched-chain amino acid transport ATP-binding protein LivF [Clostridiales bacterium]|nr:high-affinity branched-chain amino acid transport ATP-binding protein LivF [Clostridiales bacterium]